MTYFLHTFFIFNCLILTWGSFRCSWNSSSLNTTAAPCEDVVTLHPMSSTFRFNCGTDHAAAEVCQPSSKELIRYCSATSRSQETYFFTECLSNNSTSNNDNHLYALSYSTMRSLDLSSSNVTSNNCSKGDYHTVLLQNSTAIIKSPNWPFDYGDNTNTVHGCKWKINIPAKKKLKLFYMYLNLGRWNDVCDRDTTSHDSLLVQGEKDGQVVHTERYCGSNPSFAKHYDTSFDSVSLQLVFNRSLNDHGRNRTGFVIVVVMVRDGSLNNLFMYWWIIPIVALLFAVLLNCLRKKLQHTHLKHRKQRERAFTSSLTTLPTSISSHRHCSITQNRLPGRDNLGQVLEEPSRMGNFNVESSSKPALTTQISFSPTVDVYG